MDVIVENLKKRYGAQWAVNDISFQVKTGEIVGFLGPNGAGKTTTMKIITGFFAPNSGDVRVGGYSIHNQLEEVKRHIGYLPETNPLYKDMPVIDYLRFVGEIQGIDKAKLSDRVMEIVFTCGLLAEKHKKIMELSKGYQQRVGLAQALIHDPEVLILDEPTSGLDPNQIVEIRDLIRRIGKEKTVILSSHILAEVEATCNRVMIISKGKLVANDTTENVRKRQQGKEILKITIEDADKNAIFEALRKIDTIELIDPIPNRDGSFEIQSKEDLTSRRNLFKLCVDKGWILTEMTPTETKFEDVFRELTM